MDNPETLATLDKLDTVRRQKTNTQKTEKLSTIVKISDKRIITSTRILSFHTLFVSGLKLFLQTYNSEYFIVSSFCQHQRLAYFLGSNTIRRNVSYRHITSGCHFIKSSL